MTIAIDFDDAALGCLLLYPESLMSRPFVDWIAVKEKLQLKGIL